MHKLEHIAHRFHFTCRLVGRRRRRPEKDVCTQQLCAACYWSEIDLFKNKMSERLQRALLPLSADSQHICYSTTHTLKHTHTQAGRVEAGCETELTYEQPRIVKAVVSILRQVDWE